VCALPKKENRMSQLLCRTGPTLQQKSLIAKTKRSLLYRTLSVAGLSENVARQEDPTGFVEHIHASVEGHTFVDPLPAMQ
jgi:hypothetical protein